MFALIAPLLTTFAPVVVSIVGWFLQKSEADAEAQKQFYAFIANLGDRQMISADLRERCQKQLAALTAPPAEEKKP